MNKYSLGGKKRPAPVAPTNNQWRPYDHGPINLAARPKVDPDSAQKAFVIGFAALAVAGAAYFATVMISPENEPTVIATAQASPQEIRASVQAEQPPVALTDTQAAAEPATDAAAYPAPVRVKTTAVAQPAKSAPAKADATTTTAPRVVAGVVQVEDPAEMANAYANTESVVSEGVAAVMDVVAKEEGEQPAPRPARKKQAAETQVASAEPEMAGSSAGKRRIRSGVNMRAAPKSGSQIIGTIPTNASVTVAPGCKHWCAVSYNGKRGYIYKSFLR